MRGTAAGFLALVVFLVYRATLLPDFDLGDTASFQTMGGEPIITPRDGYPLYYALAQLIVLCFDNQAYAMNLLSALAGALACGVLLLVAVELCGSLLAALAAAVLFAASYTFWSQAVIAEVYTLHLLLIGLTLLLLLRWSRAPTTGRLAAFFAVYALAFGNHLSMILLLPAYTFFLLMAAPDGWRSMLSARVVLMAAVLAAAGLAQYAWNFSAIWHGEESLVDDPADVLVRCHEKRLARDDGARGAGGCWPVSGPGCTTSTCSNSSARSPWRSRQPVSFVWRPSTGGAQRCCF